MRLRAAQLEADALAHAAWLAGLRVARLVHRIGRDRVAFLLAIAHIKAVFADRIFDLLFQLSLLLVARIAAIVAAEDTPASKPAADPYQRAVLRLADAIGGPLRAAECVAIEDSRWGLESARAAGLRTVAISTSYDASEFGDADLVLPDIEALDVDTLRAIFDS